jgi:hypothetical protein
MKIARPGLARTPAEPDTIFSRASLVPGPKYRLLAATPSYQTPRLIGLINLAVVSVIESAVLLDD